MKKKRNCLLHFPHIKRKCICITIYTDSIIVTVILRLSSTQIYFENNTIFSRTKHQTCLYHWYDTLVRTNDFFLNFLNKFLVYFIVIFYIENRNVLLTNGSIQFLQHKNVKPKKTLLFKFHVQISLSCLDQLQQDKWQNNQLQLES